MKPVVIFDDAMNDEIVQAIQEAFKQLRLPNDISLADQGWRLCAIGPPGRMGSRSTIQPCAGLEASEIETSDLLS